MPTFLEYIESSKTQYINSGIVPDNTIEFEIKFYSLDYATSTVGSYGCVFGGRRWSNNSETQISTFSSVSGKGTFKYNDGRYAISFTRLTEELYTFKNHVLTLTDGETISTPTTSWAGEYPIYLFALNNGGSAFENGACRIYYLKLWKNNSLVRDFRPCLDNNNVACMYDNVSGNYFYNSGSGTFTAGPVLSDTYTVQFNDGSGNTATQYVETGVATALETPFAKRDHVLIGWDTSSAGTTVVYTPGQTVTDIAQTGQTIDLYAVWRKSWAYILMDDNGNYYSATQSGATQTLVALSGISTLTAAVFYNQGFQFIPNSTILRSLSEPTIYLWADDPWTFMDGEVDAVPYPQAIKTEVDLSAAHIIGIDEFLISYTGNVNVGYTYDGSTPSSTMTAAAFLALNPDTIYAGLTSAKKLYVFFYLQDENAVLTRFTVNYKRRKFH